MRWKVGVEPNRIYNFEYDALSQLEKANYANTGIGSYSTSYSYDKHENIKTIEHYGDKGSLGCHRVIDKSDLTILEINLFGQKTTQS